MRQLLRSKSARTVHPPTFPPVPSRTITADDRYPVTSLDSVPLGLDSDGALTTLPLVETHVLFAGAPGSGKTVAVDVGLAHLAHRPDVQLVGIGEFVPELDDWSPRLAARARTQQEAVVVLRELVALYRRRAHFLRDVAQQKSLRHHGYSAERPLYVVVVDAVPELLGRFGDDRDVVEELSDSLSQLVRLARASGIVLWLATQEPLRVPSLLPDNVQSRVLFRCTALQQVSSALSNSGVGVDELPVAPTQLSSHQPGSYVAVDERGRCTVGRAFSVDRATVQELASRHAVCARPLTPQSL